MKKFLCILSIFLCLLMAGCQAAPSADIAATTLPVYEFTARLCEGTPLTVAPIVTEAVSCLHDYSLSVEQMRTIASSKMVVISGGGLEEFLEDALDGAASVMDGSAGVELLCPAGEHDHEEDGHHQEEDPHYWLDPQNALHMCRNIAAGLTAAYPENAQAFQKNLAQLEQDLKDLDSYGKAQLAHLSCRDLITFHDGFSYFAGAYDLHILEAIEEEPGSETSANRLKALIQDVESQNLPAIFVEKNGSAASASVIAAETGCGVFTLDMALSGGSYFDAMYHNIDTIKEALG